MNRTCKALVVAAVLALSGSLFAQANVPEIAFDSNADFLRTPNDIHVGEVGGVGANSKGQIFVYTRTGHPYGTLGDNRTFYRNGSRLFIFDGNGKFVREWGQDVYGFNTANGLRIDPQDNVWTIDDSANQVVKFDTEGRIQLVLGRKPEAINVRPAQPAAGREGGGGGREGGAGGRGGAPNAPPPGSGVPGSGLNRPGDVAWDRAGNIYIADGLGNNNRIAKFDRDGKFIRQWGYTGSGQGQFNGVKSIALDAQGNVYAADLGNRRIQVFDGDGNFKMEFGNVGRPMTLCMTRGTPQYLYVSHVGDDDGMEDAAIYKVQLDGKVVGKLGSAGKLPKQFGVANSIDCRNENELLVGEMSNWRVQRVSLKR
jgi:DNA-binding beta-propeller fold protein YncE